LTFVVFVVVVEVFRVVVVVVLATQTRCCVDPSGRPVAAAAAVVGAAKVGNHPRDEVPYPGGENKMVEDTPFSANWQVLE
jgi:hypothetical protein